MNTIKEVVESLVAAGTPLSDIIRQVNIAAVDKALVMHYGNQTKAAEQLGCHRSIIRKYALVRQENRWSVGGVIIPVNLLSVRVKYRWNIVTEP